MEGDYSSPKPPLPGKLTPLHREEGGRPTAYCIPKVSGVERVFSGDGHEAKG